VVAAAGAAAAEDDRVLGGAELEAGVVTADEAARVETALGELLSLHAARLAAINAAAAMVSTRFMGGSSSMDRSLDGGASAVQDPLGADPGSLRHLLHRPDRAFEEEQHHVVVGDPQ
jgi:hypothetical protein